MFLMRKRNKFPAQKFKRSSSVVRCNIGLSLRDSVLISDSKHMFTLSKANVENITIDDRQLVNEILKGNERVLNYFYKHYYPSLYTFIQKKINESQDVEEILQDVFFAVLDGLRDFAFKSALFTYMCGIANHKIIDFYRKKRIKKIVFSHFEGIEPLISELFGPEDVFDEHILKQKIIATFKKLSPNYQLILKLKYIYGFSVEEISQKMSITFKSTESQLFRARKAFAVSFHYEKR